MATILTESIISKPNNANAVEYTYPISATSSETFTYSLKNSSDDSYVILDTANASPGNYTIAFSKGDFPASKTPASITITDGSVIFIPMESGLIEKSDSTVTFTITTTATGGLSGTGLKLALVKKRFVTNN